MQIEGTKFLEICQEAINDIENTFKIRFIMSSMVNEMIRQDTVYLLEKVKESAKADGLKISDGNAEILVEKIKEDLWKVMMENYKGYEFPKTHKTETIADRRVQNQRRRMEMETRKDKSKKNK